MIYTFDPPNPRELNYHLVQHPSDLSDGEITKIRDYGDSLQKTNLRLYGNSEPSKFVKASGSALQYNNETSWLYDKMAELTCHINDKYFHFELTGFYESFYYITYEAPNGFFDWHLDIGHETEAPRKLSLVLQLSDFREYVGGEFEVMIATTHATAKREKGLITAFPSFKIHRVRPITQGTRRVLTMFAVGPNFR